MITLTLIYILFFTGPDDQQFLSLEDDSELSSANVSSESKSSAGHEANKKHAVKDSSKKWANAVVPYHFHRPDIRKCFNINN